MYVVSSSNCYQVPNSSPPARQEEQAASLQPEQVPVPVPRVRFAPAPTGFLHVGSARTALFNWLFARGCDGEMLLRIEDTDVALKQQAFVDAILDPLRWLGIDWDADPFFQSERSDLHMNAVEKLIDSNAAYYCDLTQQDIRDRACAAGLPAGYYGWSRDRNVKDGAGVVVRFRCPDEGDTVFHDVVRGKVSFPNSTLEDFVIRRGDRSPTFLIANAVDDHDMGITHVIRGEDLLNTVPRVMLLRQALGWEQHHRSPVYAHLPLLVNSKRQKLSKRRDDVSLEQYRRRGYLPEAMKNYLALLGWTPPDGVEIRPLSEIVELFKLDAVKSAPAFFDNTRLDHINASYLAGFTPEKFAAKVEPFLDGTEGDVPWPHACYKREVVRELAPDIQQRVTTMNEVASWVDWIFNPEVSYDDKAWRKVMVKGVAALDVLEIVALKLASDRFDSASRLESIIIGVGDELTERLGVRVRSQPPVRLAVTGKLAGLPLWKAMCLLGKERSLARLREAIARCRTEVCNDTSSKT